METQPLLVIVDVQRAFSPPADFVENLRRYADDFPRRVFTRFVNPPGSLFRTVLKQSSCAPGTPDLDLLIEPRPDDLVVDKTTYGLDPKILRQLREEQVERAIVCGLDTDACVLAVMFSLFDAGIVCHLNEHHCWSSSNLQTQALAIARTQFPPPPPAGRESARPSSRPRHPAGT